LLLVAIATAVFAGLNIQNAAAFAPHWGQDLAFFHQLVHSAANGGPWASPLILEPQGFLSMVHTHLVLPVVIGAYAIVPKQETLLFCHSFFAALTLWPAFRLGESAGGRRHGLLCALAVAAFGPFQALATADFRMLVLFVPGILGVFASAHRGHWRSMILWACLALVGRQEAAALIAACGLVLVLFPWGHCRKRLGVMLLALGSASFCVWVVLKPEMFFHVNPMTGLSLSADPELWANRRMFGLSSLASIWWLGLLSPTALLAGVPSLLGMLTSSHEWHRLVGPGVHHHAFWVPFVLASGIVGAAKVPKGLGPVFLLIFGALSFDWAAPRSGPSHLQRLVDEIPADGRVAADYETIHRLAGRSVLWNVNQLYNDDKPRHWNDDWPITTDAVDWILLPSSHSLTPRLTNWTVVAAEGHHVLLQKPVNRTDFDRR
jgi:uncharacterized membrane protein